MSFKLDPTAPAAAQQRFNQAVQTSSRLSSIKSQLDKIPPKLAEIARVVRAGPRSRVVGMGASKGYFLSFIKASGSSGWTETYTVGSVLLGAQKQLTLNQVLSIKSALLRKQSSLKAEEAKLKGTTPASTTTTTTTTSRSNTSTPATTPAPPRDDTVKYNASTVKEAYFYANQSFYNQINENWTKKDPNVTPKFDTAIWAGNTPSKIQKANDLWKTGAGSKGMVLNWNPPGSTNAGGSINDGSTWGTTQTNKTKQRYGFQFLYNPTTIAMSYGGVADVDPGMQSSGTEEYLLANPTVFKSTINFEVVINRMYDIKNLNADGLKAGKVEDFYSGNVPAAQDLRDIYNKGTMYDVEYLLQTMFPYEPVESQFRGKTADIGFLGASPVELHLGNNLKYVAQINSISVNHVIFDNRMVPLFSTVSIATNRIPDYKAGQNSNPATTSSSSNTSGEAASSPSAVNAKKGTVFNPVVPGGGSLIGGIGIL
jgi:hypothetical protein